MIKMRRSIWLKIWLSNTAVILLFTVFIMLYFPNIQKNYIIESYNKETQNIANSVAWAVNIALSEENFEGVRSAMEYASSWPELAFIVLCKSESINPHQVINYEDAIMQFPPPDVLNLSKVSKESLILKYSLINSEYLKGKVVAAFSVDHLHKKISESKNISILIIILLGIASIGLSMIFAKEITNPINKLRASFKHITGNKLTKVLINTKDELEDLGNDFNLMSAKLFEANQSIANLNKTLEDKVRLRTQELNQTIRKLQFEIESKKKVQQALKNSERKVQKVISDSIDPIFILDENYNITRINQSAAKLFKYTFDQISGENFFEKILPNKDSYYHSKDNKMGMIESYYLNNRRELKVIDNNKRTFPAEISISKLKINNKPFYSVFIRDVTMQEKIKTEIKNSLKKERELNKIKSKFITMTSHELRTPLTTIQTNFELLSFHLNKQRNLPREIFTKNLPRIETELERITKMMNDVFIFSKIDSDKITFEPSEVCLTKLAENTIEKYYSERGDERTVNLRITGDPRSLKLDSNHLDVVINNLLSNAFKYSEIENPILQINYTPRDVELLVIDSGLGIPQNETKNLFSSFYRATNVQAIKGTGLGLVIIKHFVKINGGSINFKSELGKGTTFILKFPQ